VQLLRESEGSSLISKAASEIKHFLKSDEFNKYGALGSAGVSKLDEQLRGFKSTIGQRDFCSTCAP